MRLRDLKITIADREISLISPYTMNNDLLYDIFLTGDAINLRTYNRSSSIEFNKEYFYREYTRCIARFSPYSTFDEFLRDLETEPLVSMGDMHILYEEYKRNISNIDFFTDSIKKEISRIRHYSYERDAIYRLERELNRQGRLTDEMRQHRGFSLDTSFQREVYEEAYRTLAQSSERQRPISVSGNNPIATAIEAARSLPHRFEVSLDHDRNINNRQYYITSNRRPIFNESIMLGRSDFTPPTPQEKKYIHAYNYVPEYKKHFQDGESQDEHTTLLLGAEIEVDCGGKSEEHAKKGLGIICGIDPSNPDIALEDKMYCTSDGSLNDGIEFDTMPCSLEYHKKSMRYKELFEYLDKNGYKAHDTITCGLHIHANRAYLGKTKLQQQITISKILYIIEKFNDEICVLARRNCTYSSFVGLAKKEDSAIELYGMYKREGKRVALNLQHENTVEFRCFKGTLKYETFIITLEFVKNIIDYAKSIRLEDVEDITWKNVYDSFSEEVKRYYDSRKEKQEENKSQMKQQDKTVVVNEISRQNGMEYDFDRPVRV